MVFHIYLREFAQLLSSWPPARVEGGLRAAVLDTISGDPADPVDPVDPVACSKSAKSDGGLFKNRLWNSQAPKMTKTWK